ncbi:C-type lectin domain family 4 member M CD209 antigen-like protein 1 [Collichthys lucidus]|uniref:C-type lectin domain family 4 member M CD209 antigen-like protein 1 n=1 Tax=Collichthys lucidus TaxID=240159 RepID=A0A4U5VEK1_COLLU|nr:C-type lectin domain family 4 member M CD209 antigen-like protein 1 [Collichthys lucidus]
MEDREDSGGIFNGTYNKIISHEDFGTDEHPLYSNQEKQQVSVSMVGPESSLDHHKVLTAGLAVLAVILVAVDIGLGVYYNQLNDGHRIITDISSEVAKLQATYNAIIHSRDEAKEQLAKEISDQRITEWELDHQKSRIIDYRGQVDRIQSEIAVIKSHMPMIKEGCRHCLAGWSYMSSVCFYIAFSESHSRSSWQVARQYCTKQGGDLAVINSRAKHLALAELINNYQDRSRSISQSGFWIGLRDVELEGTWKWLDGTIMTEGYWNDGEPNNAGNEDCAAMYPRSNPFKAWNDAPCTYDLKWICEMAPRSAIEI